MGMVGGSVVDAVRRDLVQLEARSPGISMCALAAVCLRVASELDGEGSATSKSLNAKAFADVWGRLLSRVPEEVASDGIDEIAKRRESRRESA